MGTTTFKNAKRVQTSLLAPVEKRALHWFARHMPERINSDHLTLLGFIAMMGAGVFYYMSQWNPVYLHLVNLALLVNWFGDSLDGTLARYRNKQRPRYGFYVDHIVDAFSMLFIIMGLALSGYMSQSIAYVMLIVYLIMSINVYLATYTLGTFTISFWKLSPTEGRMLLGIGNLVILYQPFVYFRGQTYLLPDVGGVMAIVLLSVILIVSVIRNTVKLYRTERI